MEVKGRSSEDGVCEVGGDDGGEEVGVVHPLMLTIDMVASVSSRPKKSAFEIGWTGGRGAVHEQGGSLLLAAEAGALGYADSERDGRGAS